MKQTFENFLVSGCNAEAFQACTALVENPGGHFLALCGSTASGKSHLLSGVKQAFSQKYPEAKVYFRSLDEALAEFLAAMLQETPPKFEEAFCANDLLVLDNMQFLCGKSATQEWIRKWIAHMLAAEKNVVLSFDRPLEGFRDLLNGLNPRVLQLQEPDGSLRLQYLRKVLDETGLALSEDMQTAIAAAENISFSALRGFILKLRLYRNQKGAPLTEAEILRHLEEN